MTPEHQLRLLRELVELESPTYSAGVRVVAERMAEELEALGARVELRPGDHLVADLDGEGDPLLVLGHTDTVWPEGTLERMPFRLEHGRAHGPGAYDMKAGLVAIVAALAERSPRRRAVRVFLTADEEQASRTGRAPLEEAARGVAAALVAEPCIPGGAVKVARKGLGRFRLTVTGRAAHAGAGSSAGVSAIEELAHQILRLHALRDEEAGVTVNVGVVRGGRAENIVAERAEADVDVRIPGLAGAARLESALESLEPVLPGASLAWSGGWTRPPLEASPGAELLYAAARRHAAALGVELEKGGSGGGSDGNLVGALGVPVLDGLGPDGGGAHAETEHVLVDSLPVRARLLASLLRDPGI